MMMTDPSQPNDETQSSEQTATTTRSPKRSLKQVSQETREKIHRLHAHGYGARRIGPRVGLTRKVVRRILAEEGLSAPQAPGETSSTKLEAFEAQIQERVEKGLTISRTLREIRQLGYTGGRTILAERARELVTALALEPKRKKTVKRRFETPFGQEMQIDWSPYVVLIAGRPTNVRALGCLLCASRKLFLRLFRDERQSTLLEGLASAFEYFEGSTLRVVLDNMATAVLGRFGADGKAVFHPRFLDFARHYSFDPFACLPRDSDRKGKKEKSFRLVEDDFLRGSSFDSWDDLAGRTKVWLDHTPEVANRRIHGTTGLVPNEVWLSEKELLVQLPEKRFPVHEDGVRLVDLDATLSIHGTPYTVPAALAGRNVAVRLYAGHFEVLDPHGRIAFSRQYVPDSEKGKLVIDPTHYASLPRGRARRAGGRIDDAFVKRFPTLAPFVDGLRVRMKALVPIHIRALLRLADRFGQEALVRAVEHAQAYRRFDTTAVQRILEQTEQENDDPVAPLGGVGPAVLGEVETGSLDAYCSIDQRTSKSSNPSSTDEDQGGGHHGA
jgi:transposase